MIFVFDIGNVLLRWNPRNLFRRVFADEDAMETFLATACAMDWIIETRAGRVDRRAKAVAGKRLRRKQIASPKFFPHRPRSSHWGAAASDFRRAKTRRDNAQILRRHLRSPPGLSGSELTQS